MPERRGTRDRPIRGSSPGRRRTDDPIPDRVDRKVLVITVVIVNALYLAGDALLFQHSLCQ